MPWDMQRARRILAHCRVEDGRGFRLQDHDPGDTAGLALDEETRALLAEGTKRLSGLQDMLYDQGRRAVLCLFQGMDASGKDGAIRHVFSGINPQGVRVTSFKAPGPVELDHDFLWRHVAHLPARGTIGIHNRSWYEEVLVVRVHPEILETRQRLPPDLVTKRIWEERLEDIAAFERYLSRQGTVVLKFFLHLSSEEQRRRFLKRIEAPEKRWKFQAEDVAERRFWDDYQAAYEQAIRATAAPHAPWHVVPADHKWFARLAVSATLVLALEELGLHYPRLGVAELAGLDQARRELER